MLLDWSDLIALHFVQMAETMYSCILLALKLLEAFCPEAGPQQQKQKGWPQAYILTALQVSASTVRHLYTGFMSVKLFSIVRRQYRVQAPEHGGPLAAAQECDAQELRMWYMILLDHQEAVLGLTLGFALQKQCQALAQSSFHQSSKRAMSLCTNLNGTLLLCQQLLCRLPVHVGDRRERDCQLAIQKLQSVLNRP